MKITINKIDFEVSPVSPALREILLADKIIAQGVWRDVWAWDAVAGTGRMLTASVDEKAVPLGNGILFHVPKVGQENARADGPSAKMAEKLLKATGAKSMQDLMVAMNRILHLPQKTVPFEAFAPLNPVASYKIRMHVDFTALQLTNASRALTCFIMVPGACAFHHEVTAIPDQAAYDALLAEQPQLSAIQPAFVVPPRSRANLGLRTLAIGADLTALSADAAGAPGRAMARVAADGCGAEGREHQPATAVTRAKGGFHPPYGADG
jgi:hypothetical protein